jgi:exonuclease III
MWLERKSSPRVSISGKAWNSHFKVQKHDGIPIGTVLGYKFDPSKYTKSFSKNIGNLFKPISGSGGFSEITGKDPRKFPTKLKIIAQNITSINNRLNEYSLSKAVSLYEPEIILLNEFNRKLDFKMKKFMNVFSVEHTDLVAVMVRSDLAYVKLEDLCDKENIFLKVKTSEGKTLVVASVYRHPHEENIFWKKLELRLLDVMNKFQDPTIILYGDFNIDKETIKIFCSQLPDLFPVFNPNEDVYTRKRDLENGKKERSYLDYFIVKNLRNVKLDIVDIDSSSDHLALFMDVELPAGARLIKKWKNMLNLKKVKESAENNLTILIEELSQKNFSAESWKSKVNENILECSSLLKNVKITPSSLVRIFSDIEKAVIEKKLTHEEVLKKLCKIRIRDYSDFWKD